MAGVPDRDFDDLDDKDILALAEEVKQSWAERDRAIESAQEIRHKTWQIAVPPAWTQTALQQHSSLASEIPARVLGTLTLRDPVFSRVPPDDDEAVVARSLSVERATQALFQWHRRRATPGKDQWTFASDQLINKGALCLGSLFAPHSWAGSPLFTDGDGKVLSTNWRDKSGQPTDQQDQMDHAASARGYEKLVDAYRRTARPPVTRRVVPTEQAYPLFLEGEMLALFIIRKASLLEVTAGGFTLPVDPQGPPKTARTHELIECVTANRIRYYLDKKPLAHPQYGKDGMVTDYGFVPYTYQVGIEGGELEYGHYGMPLLGLVDTNIRMIDTMLTYQFNALHLASFTSFSIEYDKDYQQATLMNGDTGERLNTWDFKSGTIMDFGPGKKVVPLTHPGLNKDFDEFLKFQIEEVSRIIPRTLQGEAASSGYNSVQSSVQARAIFESIVIGQEAALERAGEMDLQHIAKRVPGPVYLNLEQQNPRSSKPKGVARVRVDAADIGDYYQLTCSIDRELDRVTLGTWALQMHAGGIFDKETVCDYAGEHDFERIQARTVRDKTMDLPEVQQALAQRAIKRFGMQDLMQDAAAMQRIQQGPNGTPMVQTPQGPAGAGQPAQPPQPPPQMPAMQGPQGFRGGMNPAAGPGLPNMHSTNNPNIAMPGNTPTQRPRLRRRGGAMPGLPQRAPGATRPTPPNPVVGGP